MTVKDRQQFYDILFNRDEGIGYQTDHGEYRTNKVVVHKGDQDEYNFDYQFYCINPIHPTKDHDPDPENPKHASNKPRITIANVTSFRNFAIEFDEDSLEEQKQKLKVSKLPFSAIVFSGSKSLHTPIALDEEITQEEYSAFFEAIRQVLLKYDLKLDPQCKNPNRLTRAPLQIRPSNGKVQTLHGVRRRISRQELEAWFEINDINWKDYIFKIKESTHEYEGSGDADDEMRWRAAVSSTVHFNNNYETSDQWQPWIYELGKWCKAYGLEEHIAQAWAQRDYSHPDSKAIPTGIKNGYKYGKLSPRTLNRPKPIKNDLDDSIFDNLLDDVVEEIPYDFNIDNYAWIGADIFLIYPDGKRVKYTSQGFNARFKPQALNVNDIQRKYSGEGYYPNYFYNGPIENNKYNAFRKPDVVPTKGEWPMTKVLLEHMFGDQLKLGIEYYWVLRHRPTQALPALCFIGPEDGGKSSIAEHLEMCFKNTQLVDTDRLTSNENSYIKNTQIIVFEESSSGGSNRLTNPAAIENKIKTMVTQCGKKHPFKELYDNAGQIDYFGHIVMLSNDTAPIRMSGEATRYWVIKIGKPKKYVDFMRKIESELPYFLYYLDNEFQPSREQSKERLWFHPDEYYTMAKDLSKDVSGSKLYRTIKDSLIEWFSENESEQYCIFDAKSLSNYISDGDQKWSRFDVKDCLINEFKYNDPKDRKILPDHLVGKIPTGNGQTEFESRKMMYWKIDRNFLEVKNTEEMRDLDDVFTI